MELTRARDAKPTPPPDGTPVLLDPRKDDPLAYLRLDLRDTFTFRPTAAKGTTAYTRAEWTLRVLGLNERDELIRQRRTVYESHLSHLHRAAAAKRDLRRVVELDRIRGAILGLSCGFVWLEMKRRRGEVADVDAAFTAVPQALGW